MKLKELLKHHNIDWPSNATHADHNLEITRRPKILRIGNQFYWESDLK